MIGMSELARAVIGTAVGLLLGAVLVAALEWRGWGPFR